MASVSTPTVRLVSTLESVSSPVLTPKEYFLSPTTTTGRRARNFPLPSTTGTLGDHENDDAKEKQKRKKTHLTEMAMESPGSTSTTPKSARTASRLVSVEGCAANGSTGLTNLQLKDLYSNCLKLSTENKINAKNAFGLHLIDYMQELLTDIDKDQGVTNFQIASCTLDASTKIYAGRVDSIHSQAYKMLGGLGRAENGNDDGDEEVDSGGPQCVDHEKALQKKKAHKLARTIETNLNNITLDQFDMEFEVDPLFQKTSASFDEGGTCGLLLNNLQCRDDFCELLLDSNTVTTHTVADFNAESFQRNIDLPGLLDIGERILSLSVQICPQFADFCFTNWDRNAETLAAGESEISVHKLNEHAFDVDNPATFDPVIDDLPEVGDDGFDDQEEVFDDQVESGNSLTFADGQEAQVVLSGQMRPPDVASRCDLGSLVLSLTSEQTEYSYFEHNLAMWAGPEHWKNRAQFSALKGLSKSSKKASKAEKSSTKKKVFRIDFNLADDFDKQFSKGKAATVLSKKTVDKHSSNQNTLPDDLHYEFSNLMKLMLKSKLLVRRQYGVQPAVTDDGIGNNWYDYENANDCNYCPDTQDDDDDGEIGGFNECSSQEMSQAISSFNSNEAVANETVFQGDNLVAQPNKVQKIDIQYSRTAKKIDVKKVKKAMWDILISHDADKENVPENEMPEDDVVLKESITKPCSFIDLLNTLPTRISKQMAKNVSIPIAFVSLLHLANEKCLKIEGCKSMDNLTITQGI